MLLPFEEVMHLESLEDIVVSVVGEKIQHFHPIVMIPRDPGSPSENGFMKPKYLAFRR